MNSILDSSWAKVKRVVTIAGGEGGEHGRCVVQHESLLGVGLGGGRCVVQHVSLGGGWGGGVILVLVPSGGTQSLGPLRRVSGWQGVTIPAGRNKGDRGPKS